MLFGVSVPPPPAALCFCFHQSFCFQPSLWKGGIATTLCAPVLPGGGGTEADLSSFSLKWSLVWLCLSNVHLSSCLRVWIWNGACVWRVADRDSIRLVALYLLDDG